MASLKAGSFTAPERPEDSHTVPERSEGLQTVPERSEGSHTVPTSSDEGYGQNCESCIGVTKEAKYYCQDCRRNICDTCKDRHRKFAVTRNHTIVPVNKSFVTVASTTTNSTEKRVLLGSNVKACSQVNVMVGDDNYFPRISGCTIMVNGDAVLCDSNNQKIKLLNSSGVITGNMNLSRTRDVSILNSRSVIVTLPQSMQLQIIPVYPQLKLGGVIQLDKKCWGVEVGKEEIYVTCHNDPGDGEIRVFGRDGNVKRRLGVNQDGSFMFISPYYITVNSSGEKIFISDWKTDTVTCMSVDGHVIYAYKDASLREPVGLLCDSEDNILVCGQRSQNIQVITPDGKMHCSLLTSSEGLKYPSSIAYRDSDSTLLVGCRDNKHLLSFQLSK